MKKLLLNNLFVYFGFLLIMVLVFIFGLKYQQYLQLEARTTYQPQASIVFSVLFPIFFGVLLGLLRLFDLLRKPGEWKINWIKLCIFGIPSLCVSLVPLLYWSGLPISYYDLPLGHLLITSGTTPHTISGLIFGFLLFYVIERKIKES
ncbi:hypothetical protein ACINKY_20760 [Paenibacillus illinoisensis]|uniref:Uncharacterized protein n=1 Tax=Paenibacillus illinoisensis TaxID=59845 RepID=A0ABW8HYB9_9BACL